MAVIDWVLVAVLGISGLISLKRGFVKEALSLATWILALIIARWLSGNLATVLAGSIDSPSLRWMVAFAILFVGTLVVGALINHLVVELVRLTGLSGTDRVLGMFFGLLRGVIILVVLVYGAQFTMLPSDDWWQHSQLIPYLESIADWIRKTFPAAQAALP